MTLLGGSALWLAFLLGVWGAIAGFAGGRTGRPDLQRSARHAVFAMCAALLTAVFSLEWALFHHDFNVEYVAAYTSRNLPTFYTWSALYAGQKGSLLFWATVLTVFGSLAQILTAGRHRVYLPYVAAVTAVVAAFFVSVMLFAANPFERLAYTPLDGRGMNPQLQNPGMVFHPPMLYLGYISITIPFAFAIAALLSRRLDTDWLVAIRKWTLLSWLFLSIGICLGMWWAYVELGWGGYWAWDPVENASLLPWLTMTAFLIVAGTASFALYANRLPLLEAEARLESMVSREASFLFNNLLFLGIAFSVLWGTLFPILSELVQGTKVTVGPPFFNLVNIPLGLALLALTGIGPLIAWRRASVPNLQRQFAVPATVGVFTALILLVAGMRDFYALMAIGLGGFVVGTVVQEFARGARARHRQYGEGYVLALGRLIARNRRRYGGYIVHTGIVILFVAFAGMAFKTETEASLRPGESASIKSPYGWTYRLTHLGISQYDALNRQVTAATLEVSRDGKRLGVLTTEKRQHVDALGRPTFQPSTEVGIRSDLREDLYVVLGGVVNGTEQAVFRFTINPLVWWVWYGGMIVALGGLIVMWPGGSPAAKRSQAGYAVRLVGEAR